MNNAKQLIKRRQHRRRKISGHIMVSNTAHNGPIIDISLGGASFQYVEDNECQDTGIKLGTIIGSDLCLSQIPIEAANVSKQKKGNIVLCRCGLKFGELLPESKKKLTQFLLNHSLNREKSKLRANLKVLKGNKNSNNMRDHRRPIDK